MTTLTTAEYIRKSLIASYIGNIIGALFVGLPAAWFYLGDYEAGGIRNAEQGNASRASSSNEGSAVADRKD
ncbi:hypothetical protein D9758_002009 [Tetrapyrgos nigripes]|uniref:Uncharacterized protein n=1 Tax=Tetrapyrgos nigripes TaxID=182062 RepID=A0A8H5LUQ4_9AGAR|nr:hypothetical protein D9758_002009 [Tetrapyrgos nigripes]